MKEIYSKIQEAKALYKKDPEAGRALYKEVTAPLEGITGPELTLWRAYETSMDCGNEYPDFDSPIKDGEIGELISSMRKQGFTAFTYSSTWSSAVETAWLFQKAGCRLEGLVEINSQHKAFMSDEYEKAHGYLFKL